MSVFIRRIHGTNNINLVETLFNNREYLYRGIIGVILCSYLLSTDGISLFIGIPSVESR